MFLKELESQRIYNWQTHSEKQDLIFDLRFSFTHPEARRLSLAPSAAMLEVSASLGRISFLLTSPRLPDSWQMAPKHWSVTLINTTGQMVQLLSKGGFGWGLWLQSRVA